MMAFSAVARKAATSLPWLLLALAILRELSAAGTTCSVLEVCPRFRVFNNELDEQYLNNLSVPESLQFVASARTRTSHVVRMTRHYQIGYAQVQAALSLDCQPWIELFGDDVGDHEVAWFFVRLHENGSQLDRRVSVDDEGYELGGEDNRWLNISSIFLLPGDAGQDDRGIFICQVCRFSQCHNSSYTSRVVGIPPSIARDSVGCVSRGRRQRVNLRCVSDNERLGLPSPGIPSPRQSWYKDGALVSTNGILEDDFIMNNTILMNGIFVPDSLTTQDGGILYHTYVDNITAPQVFDELGLNGTEEAEEELFSLLLGNWTCVVQNEVGMATLQYRVQECETEEPVIDLGWLHLPSIVSEPSSPLERDVLIYYVGVFRGAELLQEYDNITFMVVLERLDKSNNAGVHVDVTIRSTLVVLFPPFNSTAGVELVIHSDDIAHEYIEYFSIRLVLLTPLNETGVILRENIALYIYDNDIATVSWSESEYFARESDGTVTVQLVKDKRIARPLELVVTVLTVQEAEVFGCLSFNTTLMEAEVDKDFVASSYFENVVVFEADEGLPNPVNKLNISIQLVDDANAESTESFVITVQARGPCHGLLPLFSRQSALVHIFDDDNCPEDRTYLPAIGTVLWPTTTLGLSLPLQCPGVEDASPVTRLCNLNGSWSDPDFENCSKAIIDRGFEDILDVLNQSSVIDAAMARQLVTYVGDTVNNTVESGLRQDEEALEIVEEVLETVRAFLEEEEEGFAEPGVSEEVIGEIVGVLDNLIDWPAGVVQQRSSNIVESFEAITTNIITSENFTTLTSITDDVIFVGNRARIEDLTDTEVFLTFSTAKVGANSSDVSEQDISRISLPPSLFRRLQNMQEDEYIGLFFTSYVNPIFFPIAVTGNESDTFLTVGSSVLAANVLSDQPIRDLMEPITLEFRVQNVMDAVSVSCVSWDFEAAGGRGNWTTGGCEFVKSDEENTVKCRCNHLTPFSVLIESCRRVGTCQDQNKDFEKVLEIASYIGVSISIACLVVTIITVAALLWVKSRSSKERERQSSIQFKFYIQLCIALLCLYVAFIAGIDRTERFPVCVLFSALIHYFSLTSVLWMSATCGFIFWILVVNPFSKTHFNNVHMLVVTVLCWVIPLVPVVIPLAIDRDSVVTYGNSTGDTPRLEYCFISDEIVFFAAFLGPLLLLVLMNAVMYVGITFVQLRYVCCVRKKRVIAETDDKNGAKSSVGDNFVTLLKLWCIFCLFGLSWLFGALAVTKNLAYISSTLFALFTSLQGFFIFVFLCLLSKDALVLYRSLCCRYSEAYQMTESQQTKSSSLTGKNFYQMEHSEATKSALAQELSVKVKSYDHDELPDVVKTSTFKPVPT